MDPTVFAVGSGQIWRHSFYKLKTIYFLDFLPHSWGRCPERAEGVRDDAKLVSSYFGGTTDPLRLAGAQHLPHEWGRKISIVTL